MATDLTAKILIIGELNPYGGNPDFAMYPSPARSAGHNLCCKIMGMKEDDYLELFDRANLCTFEYKKKEARKKALELRGKYDRMILLGKKVTSAFDLEFVSFCGQRVIYQEGEPEKRFLVLPHPSGRNTIWNWPESIDRARAALIGFMPEHVDKLGPTKYIRALDPLLNSIKREP